MITIKQLKEKIKDLPDDALIEVSTIIPSKDDYSANKKIIAIPVGRGEGIVLITIYIKDTKDIVKNSVIYDFYKSHIE